MDNKYTRKEEDCPLIQQLCNKEDKNCNRCIGEEEEWQVKEFRKEAEKMKMK